MNRLDEISEREKHVVVSSSWSESITDEQRDRIERAHHVLCDGGTLFDAIAMRRGDEQQRIAAVGLEWIDLLLRKNADYGTSVWKPPILRPGMNCGDAMLVRMSDKIERVRSLLSNGRAEVDESLRDSLRDLGAYCLLYLAMPETAEVNDEPRS